MLNQSEVEFVKNFLAILRLEGYNTIDLKKKRVDTFMKYLKIEMLEYEMFANNRELIYLFLVDNNGIYHHLQRIIRDLNPSIAIYDELNNILKITLDESSAHELLDSNIFSEKGMLDMVQKMLPVMGFKVKEKVK